LTGPQGLAGSEGKAGSNGNNGGEGKEGKEGKSGFTKTLPSGEAETGSWAYSSEIIEAGVPLQTAISFSIPLASELSAEGVHFVAQSGEEIVYNVGTGKTESKGKSANCPGTVTEPKALKGNLCVYTFEEENLTPVSESVPLHPAGKGNNKVGGTGATGAVLSFESVGSSRRTAAFGTWVVTAP